ncbi:MAG TPA: fimbrial protein [Scandinavium sp.]|uniref:fimbrial protein n=1 Tax=Scandinavium sp. TaxID=2830653 RepID=UPI002E33A8DC|nr:fimbrial protein [Scandinavium sp.]HEX4500710.1 fimbrial protein [Scandinavium sp.]
MNLLFRYFWISKSKIFTLILLCFSLPSMATCYFSTGVSYQTRSFHFGPVTVQRDADVGTVLATAYQSSPWDSGEPGISMYGCDTAWTEHDNLGIYTEASGVYKTYNTNVPGIGIRVKDGVIVTSAIPSDMKYRAGVYTSAEWSMHAQLIKTGPVTAGTINPGVVFKLLADSMPIAEITLDSSTKIIPVACSVSSSSTITAALGNITLDNFTGVGSQVGKKGFEVGLQCDPDANINVSLTGVQNSDTTDKSVLAIGDSTASGVGVQILYNDQPLQLNKNIVLKQSEGGQELFPFSAQYYQTKASVTAGPANAVATLNFTYQ